MSDDNADAPTTPEPAPAASANPPPRPSGKEPPEEAPPKKAAPARAEKPSSQRPVWPNLLFGFVLVAALGGAGYYFWYLHQQDQAAQAALQEAIAEQQATLEQLQSRLQQTQNALADRTQKVAEQQENLAAMEQQLAGLRERMFSMAGTTTDDWKLAEAHYLLRIAGQRLVMDRDPEGTLALLEAADDILRNRQDPELFPVREQVADDIEALRLLESVDREGVYLQLAALNKQIAGLPVAGAMDFEQRQSRAPADDNETDNAEGWQRVTRSFSNAVAKLQDFVRVSHPEEALRPLPSPEQQTALRQQAQLQLTLAQAALLREQGEIYRNSLAQAQTVLRNSFHPTPARNQIIARLQELQNAAIEQTLPDISASQKALGAYLERLQRLAPEGDAQ